MFGSFRYFSHFFEERYPSRSISPSTAWAIRSLRATTLCIRGSSRPVVWTGLRGCGRLRKKTTGVHHQLWHRRQLARRPCREWSVSKWDPLFVQGLALLCLQSCSDVPHGVSED